MLVKATRRYLKGKVKPKTTYLTAMDAATRKSVCLTVYGLTPDELLEKIRRMAVSK